MGNSIWKSREVSEEHIDKIVNEFKMTRPAAVYLSGRGIEPDKVTSYMKSSLKELGDPFVFLDMYKSVARLWEAIEKGEAIVIHGDYDTDGVTATALLTWVLEENGARVYPFLPDRFDDGYGFTAESLEKAVIQVPASEICKVAVTVDCGINSGAAIQYAKKEAIDVIVTDHHDPGDDDMSDAFAIINPKYNTGVDEYKILAGVGVAFKLAHGFIKYGRQKNLGGFSTDLNEVLDLVALGTIADIVPLTGENRLLTSNGIVHLKKQLRPGIRALFELANVKKSPKPTDITFKLAPRINAAGRLGNATTALKLLMSPTIIEAYQYANELDDFNKRRQAKEFEIYTEAKNQIALEADLTDAKSIVVAGDDWHQGVIGIVASRLVRDFSRPSIVLTIKDGEAQGSGRSLPGINLVETLSACSHLLVRYGGHPMAVGLSLKEEHIAEFAKLFEKTLSTIVSEDDLVSKIYYDGTLSINQVNDDFLKLLGEFEPYGHANQTPVFRINDLYPDQLFAIGDKHSRGKFIDSNKYSIDFIAFNVSKDLLENQYVDVLATPQYNDFYNPPRLQLNIVDVKASY